MKSKSLSRSDCGRGSARRVLAPVYFSDLSTRARFVRNTQAQS